MKIGPVKVRRPRPPRTMPWRWPERILFVIIIALAIWVAYVIATT